MPKSGPRSTSPPGITMVGTPGARRGCSLLCDGPKEISGCTKAGCKVVLLSACKSKSSNKKVTASQKTNKEIKKVI